MIGKITCFLIVCLSQASFCQAQDRSVLNGKIITSNYSDLAGVYVINAQTESMTTTNESGAFSIIAKAGDQLVFSAIQFKEKRVLLTTNDFSDLNFTVKLAMVVNQLNEVIVKNYSGINAVSLGVIPSGQKSYTAAERKLYTATDLDARVGLGGSMSIDPLLNMFSGRSAMLKKEVAVEKKELFMKLLEKMFTMEHFVERLKIPLEYVKGFEYYAVENDKFTVVLNSKNKTSTEFLLGELAVKYKEIIASENK